MNMGADMGPVIRSPDGTAMSVLSLNGLKKQHQGVCVLNFHLCMVVPSRCNGATMCHNEGGATQRRGLRDLEFMQPYRATTTATNTFLTLDIWVHKYSTVLGFEDGCTSLLVFLVDLFRALAHYGLWAKAPRCRWPPLISKCLDAHFIRPTTVGGRIQGPTTGTVWGMLRANPRERMVLKQHIRIVNLSSLNDNFRDSERQDLVNS